MHKWPTPGPPARNMPLTDLLRPPTSPSHHQNPLQSYDQQRSEHYVKQEHAPLPSGYVAAPPGSSGAPMSFLLSPRPPLLPAFADVLRTTNARDDPHHQQQQQQPEREPEPERVSQVDAQAEKSCLVFSRDREPSRYALPAMSGDCYRAPELSTFSATFMNRPPSHDAQDRSRFALPSLAAQGLHVTATASPRPQASRGEATPTTPGVRPASRTCKFAGCTHYVVDHGLCVRHGGGKRCTADGCSSRAKHFGRCWRHGGSMECKTPGCPNRAKSRGYCWSHGGGTKCKARTCGKIAISNGLCWAHGGGKRCIVTGCRKQAYERTRNYCNSHFQQFQQALLDVGETSVP